MGVQNSALVSAGAFPNLAWDDFRIFLAVAEGGSIKSAARSLSCSLNTVRSHIKRLEDLVGVKLIVSTPSGVTLTLAGDKLREVALDMKAASRGVARSFGTSVDSVRPKVHLSITEGIGTFWMVPRFAQFHLDHPEIQVTLDCKMSQVDIYDPFTDIAIQLERTTDESLVCTHLGTLHLMPFGSRDYLKKFGTPASLSEGRQHKWVVQNAEQVRTELVSIFAGEMAPRHMVALQTNSSAAHYWAIAKGIGLGVLPTYARAITGNIVPIDMGLQFRRDIWLVYHPDAKQSKSATKAISWIRNAFDAKQYRWFADEFLHPYMFESEFADTNIVRLFADFTDISALE
jgi:DNA-binding transcriptional LysR family regulator